MDKRIHTEIVINAGAADVWKVLTDFESYPQWNPFILSIEGKAVKGERLKNTLKNGDKTIVFKPVVQEVTPLVSFSWLGSLFVKGIFDGRHYFKLEEISARQVKLVHGEAFSGILSSFILKKIGADTAANFVKMNQALKLRAESVIS